jgi:hypothetical protein
MDPTLVSLRFVNLAIWRLLRPAPYLRATSLALAVGQFFQQSIQVVLILVGEHLLLNIRSI